MTHCTHGIVITQVLLCTLKDIDSFDLVTEGSNFSPNMVHRQAREIPNCTLGIYTMHSPPITGIELYRTEFGGRTVSFYGA
jgi:hypothetical protein